MHLIEIHEQAWCPAGIRNGATDCLNMLANVGQQYRFVLPLIRQALDATQADRIIDLCSGGGGPWFSLARQLAAVHDGPVQILLTDRFPSETAMHITTHITPYATGGRVRYLADPVDATQVPPALQGFRTLFTAFHHFPPGVAQAILQNAVDHRQGIGIFEQTRRHPLAFLIMLVLPVVALLTVPFMRPFRWSRLFWTYLIPAIPCVLCFDGIVSCLRTYSTDELQSLIAGLHAPAYVWKVGHLPSPLSPIGVTYAVGYPNATD
jgi:hypothetical protein